VSTYAVVPRFTQAVKVDFDSEVTITTSASVNTDEAYRPVDAEVVAVHVRIGPMGMALSTGEALDLAEALIRATMFYREQKAKTFDCLDAAA
jgi:hypothetical protein